MIQVTKSLVFPSMFFESNAKVNGCKVFNLGMKDRSPDVRQVY